MPVKPDTYRQLTAMANASDRANRPRTLLLIPALALLAGLIFLAVSYSSFGDARRRVEAEAFQAQRLARLVGTYESLQRQRVDLSDVYPPVELELKVLEAYDDAGIPFDREPRIQAERQQLLPATRSNVVRTTVKAIASNESLENILRWTHNVVHHPDLEGRAFVYAITLTPLPMSEAWSATIDFAIYETREN